MEKYRFQPFVIATDKDHGYLIGPTENPNLKNAYMWNSSNWTNVFGTVYGGNITIGKCSDQCPACLWLKDAEAKDKIREVKKTKLYSTDYRITDELQRKLNQLDKEEKEHEKTRIRIHDNEYTKHEFKTVHDYAYHGFFKPDLTEVFEQIPKKLLDQVEETIYVNTRMASDDIKEQFTKGNTKHKAITTILLKCL